MNRKPFKLFALIVILSMILISCSPAATPQAQAPAENTAAPQPANTQAPAPSTEKVKLTIGWWGEQEAPGMSKWLDESIAMFEKTHPNVEIEQVLESTENLAPSFQAAAAANQGPDIYTPWPGAWTIEDAAAGNYLPLDDYVSKDTLDSLRAGVRPDRTYEGKLYGFPLYMSTSVIAYNKSSFTKAGLDPEQPFKTWDELIAGSQKLKDSGVVPFTFGWKDTWISDWFWASWGVKNMDGPKDMIPLFKGEVSANEPKFRDWLDKIAELQTKGFINDDVASLEMSQGVDSIAAGKGAMSMVPDNTLAMLKEKMGTDLGAMSIPQFGTGKLSNASCIGSSGGLSIPRWSKDPKLAGEFIDFLLSAERVNAFFDQVGVIPLSTRFDGNKIKPGSVSEIQYKILTEKPITFCPSIFTPVQVNEQGFYIGAQEVAFGQKTPEEAAKLIDEVIKKWDEENPDKLTQLVNWLNQ